MTRVDPRNGTRTTIDLAICNEFLISTIQNMKIDEDELFRPTNYKGTKTTKTDHNTIIIDIKVNKVMVKKEERYMNTKSAEGKAVFMEKIQSVDMKDLFLSAELLNEDYHRLTCIWKEVMEDSFKKVKKSRNRSSGIDDEVKELVKEERKVKKEWSGGTEKDRRLIEIREEVSIKIAKNLEQRYSDTHVAHTTCGL